MAGSTNKVRYGRSQLRIVSVGLAIPLALMAVGLFATPLAAQTFEYARPGIQPADMAQGNRLPVDPCVDGGPFTPFNRCSTQARQTAARAFCRRAGHDDAESFRVERRAGTNALLHMRPPGARSPQFLSRRGADAFENIRCRGGRLNNLATTRGVEITRRSSRGAVRAVGTTTWGTQVVPFLSSTTSTCARGGFPTGIVVGQTRPLVGSPLVGRFGLLCDHPTRSDYTESFGDRNIPLQTFRCPRGFHLYGITGRAGLAVDRIGQIRCRRVDSAGRAENRTVRVSVGGSAGNPVTVECNTIDGVLSVQIFKNIAIDKLEWTCRRRG